MASLGSFRTTARRLAAHAPTTRAGVHVKSIGRTKPRTTVYGIDVHPSPFKHLIKTYDQTLHLLSKMPPGAVYRQSVEAVVNQRRSVVAPHENLTGPEVESKVATVEAELGAGEIEEVVLQAEDELALAAKMLDHKPWEELEVKPEAQQWEYFHVPASTSNPRN